MSQISMSRDAEPTAPARRPASPWVWLAAGMVLLATGVLLGYAVIRAGATRTGELSLDEYFGAHHTAVLDAVALGLGVAFGPIAGPLALLAAGAIVWVRHRPAAVTLVAVTVVGWLSVGAGKLLFHRERPPHALVHALTFEGKADSFPSGHAAFGFALLFGAVLALRAGGRSTRLAWLVGLPAALGVAVSRVYLGAHYLADVVAALLFAAGAVASLVAVWLTVTLSPGFPSAPARSGGEPPRRADSPVTRGWSISTSNRSPAASLHKELPARDAAVCRPYRPRLREPQPDSSRAL